MPFRLRKVPNKTCYMVYKKRTKSSGKRVFSKCTTLKKAKKQLKLLRAIQFNKDFVPRKTAKNRSKKNV